MEVKQEPREEHFEVKIKTEPSKENCYNRETYYVNNCDSFKIKQEVLKIEDEEVFDLNSEPSNSNNDINIKHEEVEHEEQFEICEEIETVGEEGKMSGEEETQNDELYSKALNTDEKIEIFDEFCEHKDFKEELDVFQNNKTTFESINKIQENDLKTDIESNISIDNNLSTNEQQYSNEQIKLQCEFCDKSFTKKVSMDDHLLKYHPEISKSKLISLITYKIYTCNMCSYSTTHKGSLHSHRITHRDQLKTKCKFCDEEFVKKVSMEHHLLKHHTELSETDLKELITSKVLTCKVCPYKTTHKHCLDFHINTKHSKKQLKCNFCDESFVKKVSLNSHLLKQHPELTKSNLNSLITYTVYRCKTCFYSTTHKRSLHRHNMIHSDQRKKIKCKFCDESFIKKVSMENHIIKHHTDLSETDLKGLITNKVFTCNICPYKTMHKHSLDSHNNTKHSKEQLKCNFCEKVFAQKISMDDHLLKHHQEVTESNLNSLITNKVYTCKICSYSTTHKGNLHIHNITHSDQRLKIKCKFCDEEFVKKVSMEDHLLKHHTELSETDLKGLITSKVMTCKMCSYKTTHKNCLDYHITNHGKKQFKCKYCEEVFVEKLLMDDHLLKLHPELTKSNVNNYKVHTCKICSFTTTNKRSLDMHNITHSDQRLKINCKFCDESFLKKVSLDDHLLKNHPELSKSDLKTLITYKVYTCKTCSYSTTHKGCLHSHNITHRDQQLKVKCKFCDDEFVKKTSMEDHLLKHHTELSETGLKELITSKVLMCKICPYKTTHKNCLNSHVNAKHSKKQRLKCNFCDESFVKKVSMDNHILKHHSELIKTELIEEQPS